MAVVRRVVRVRVEKCILLGGAGWLDGFVCFRLVCLYPDNTIFMVYVSGMMNPWGIRV